MPIMVWKTLGLCNCFCKLNPLPCQEKKDHADVRFSLIILNSLQLSIKWKVLVSHVVLLCGPASCDRHLVSYGLLKKAVVFATLCSRGRSWEMAEVYMASLPNAWTSFSVELEKQNSLLQLQAQWNDLS